LLFRLRPYPLSTDLKNCPAIGNPCVGQQKTLRQVLLQRKASSMTTQSLNDRVKDATGANAALSKLRESSKRRLLTGAAFQALEKGAAICQQETPAVRFWIVLRGEVKLLTYTATGLALLSDIVLPNQLFGAVFHNHDPVYCYSAVAAKRTELLSFRLKDLIDDLEENPPLQRMLLAETSHKLCQAQRMRGLWLEEARVRIAHFLLYLHGKFGRVIPQTRATLAELAGTSVETAIRASNVLARRGILSLRRGQIEILSLPRLQACAQGQESEVRPGWDGSLPYGTATTLAMSERSTHSTALPISFGRLPNGNGVLARSTRSASKKVQPLANVV
jgi:CRP/FNR family transcriptional regulator, nitrogen oxide reductase regulator